MEAKKSLRLLAFMESDLRPHISGDAGWSPDGRLRKQNPRSSGSEWSTLGTAAREARPQQKVKDFIWSNGELRIVNGLQIRCIAHTSAQWRDRKHFHIHDESF